MPCLEKERYVNNLDLVKFTPHATGYSLVPRFYQKVNGAVVVASVLHVGGDSERKKAVGIFFSSSRAHPGRFLVSACFIDRHSLSLPPMATSLVRIVTSTSKFSLFPSFAPSVAATPAVRLVCCRGVASKLFVGGLSYYTDDSGLAEAFAQYGQVVEAKVVMDRVSDRSKGFGFVTFASEGEAEKALDEMNGKMLNGRVIYVDRAKPQMRGDYGMPIARGPPGPRVPAPDVLQLRSD